MAGLDNRLLGGGLPPQDSNTKETYISSVNRSAGATLRERAMGSLSVPSIGWHGAFSHGFIGIHDILDTSRSVL